MQRKTCAILFRLGTAVLTCLAVFVFIADAQSTRRRPRTKASSASPAAATAPVAKPPAVPPADTIATVNGNPITMAEIETDVRTVISQDPDPYLRNFYEDPAKATAAARQRALEARINSLLIATEAKKQRKTAEEFRQLEINNRISSPTEQEIQGVFEANRAAFGTATLADVRPQIIDYLRSQRAEELYVNLANRLRMTNLVTKGADVNSPNLAPATVLATVGGTPITAGSLDERMKVYLYGLLLRIYEIRKIMLDRKINDQLLQAEATRKSIHSSEVVRNEITAKRRPPTEAEIKQFYDENRERIPGELAGVREAISQFLENQQQEKLEIALAERLRSGANFKVLLPEPQPPVQMISRDDDPARGDKNAAVTIVEFTDFQCPACGAIYPILEEVLRGYGNSVHFVVRDFPLVMHADSRKAAEAANAAHAQGKFFEYIALLFKNQKALDTESLKKYAGSLGLDQKRFDAELDSGMYAAEVQHDVEDGEIYGIHSTPTIFVNGVNVRELSAEGLRAAIDGAMGKRAPASKP